MLHDEESLTNFRADFSKVVLIYNITSSTICSMQANRSGWGFRSTAVPLGMDRKHIPCVSTCVSQIQRSPCGWRAVGEIEESPHHQWSMQVDTQRLFDKNASAHCHYTHIHRCTHTLQTVHFNANKCSPLFWEESSADCIFSLSYGSI